MVSDPGWWSKCGYALSVYGQCGYENGYPAPDEPKQNGGEGPANRSAIVTLATAVMLLLFAYVC